MQCILKYLNTPYIKYLTRIKTKIILYRFPLNIALWLIPVDNLNIVKQFSLKRSRWMFVLFLLSSLSSPGSGRE